ncbi:uncharacterized protein CELE_T24D5.6 [Caenorhabditis elegans]|uniref:Uncharacterized protein n=1 Tax=Caenorhabditis elegans TaxID=6239 RepID=G5ED72_CAEEL|nr:Uncharacterized protein CELE_T24D5.6 [Caenorhabditis elegans]CAI79185.2 Uncharacterized protein CELE_T24D5.6 [Caenorhabditis elegans]|eukprot:NP_001024926.2 Uncharacterized protein CELE_T24D5.6 [Caenorhabditis elegans]
MDGFGMNQGDDDDADDGSDGWIDRRQSGWIDLKQSIMIKGWMVGTMEIENPKYAESCDGTNSGQWMGWARRSRWVDSGWIGTMDDDDKGSDGWMDRRRSEWIVPGQVEMEMDS